MKILKLTTENVKRLSAVHIEPNGNIITIGGRNAQGKTSVLDSIWYALGGGSALPKQPVRRGEMKGSVELDLGELTVLRTFTAEGGTALTVTDAAGHRSASPQGVLDKLVGKLSFDPLEFSRQKPPVQAETLRALVGLDFAELDAEAKAVFEDRSIVNKEVKSLEARLSVLPKIDDVPETEQTMADILAEQRKASEQNQVNESVRQEFQRAWEAARAADAQVNDLAESLEELRRKVKEMESALQTWKEKAAQAASNAEALQAKAFILRDIDLVPFQARASEIESINGKVRQNQDRAKVSAQLREKAIAANTLTARLDTIASDKRKQTAAAKWPIPGLGFSDLGAVLLNGLPLEQASSAEQLKVSLAIGLALNPKLRVLLIRDGSLLDSGSLAVVAEMAEKADAQVWIEVVRTDGTVSVVIEDGHVTAERE